ncbi:acetoin utilization protein acuB [Psychroflexus sp. ALD_RP9]|uniref:acetoin utilization protein acuB n=1 Tax=Psychroflexus sp. ALD_RP9 TaxID=2777186 RepID=UPI001A90046E|nr:acetoin utilization protein acuB [Psychroflexus sp. ALD_RP9]QSS96229.1 acetoin utilization protein acuB [Psychroflexus sp. ALD_RP9]
MNWFSVVNQNPGIIDLSNLPKNFEVKFSHAIITEGNYFKGLMQAEDLKLSTPKRLAKDLPLYAEYFFASEYHTLLDVFSLFLKHESNILPVVDDKNLLIGSLEFEAILDLFNETEFVSHETDSLLLKKSTADFSYAEISQILESLNAQILGMFTCEINNNTIEFLIKLKHQGLNEILQTLRRYDYEILSKHEDDAYSDSLKDRSNYLTKFLNI